MKSHLVFARAALVLLASVAVASAATPESKSRSPSDLVDAALRTELDGPSPERESLLKQALAMDPDFARARWHLGFVSWNDEWLTLDQVAKRVAGDPKFAEYRKRRDAMIETADNHTTLAQWCQKNGLADEARVHWAKVLEFDVNNPQAQAALGLQLHNGRLLTTEQIAAEQKRAGQWSRAMKQWQPQAVKWRKAMSAGRAKDRLDALEALHKLSDPEVIPALEATFAENRASKTFDELNLQLIETAGRMKVPEATQVLLRRAILPDSQKVREAACADLKKRPMFAYVPQLIAAIPGSIKTQFHVTVLPGGMVLHQHEMTLQGREFEVSLNYESAISPTDAFVAMVVTPAAFSSETQKATAVEDQAHAIQANLDWLRERVQFVLERTTGFSNVNDPELWEKAYNDYHSWYTAPKQKRYYNYSSTNTEAYFATPTNTIVRPGGEIFRDPTRPSSCFPAGTQVATAHGARPIEQVAAGDRVVVVDVQSGELSIRPVQERTVRSAKSLVKIQLGSSAVSATRGHAFWVNGQGWVLAKDLKVGQVLHGIDGAVVIDGIGETPAAPVYNLVVGDAGTYFVGESGVLVHDNTPLAETIARVPGLSDQALSP